VTIIIHHLLTTFVKRTKLTINLQKL